ncbi:DUF885 domain-containing protein [Sphingomonas sp.]|uniref:DUF885 domain-containing protein n=1 Tax=Sphingomonas sp. TaxID=28214 RepID=UPI003D6D5E30
MSYLDDDALARALCLIDRVWQMTEAGPWTISDRERPIDRLPDLSEAAAIARSARAGALVADIDTIDASPLPHDVATTLAVARMNAARWAREGEWYWLVFDPVKAGFFAMFAPTAYAGGFLLGSYRTLFASFMFESFGDVDRYLGLVSDFARLVRQFDARTKGQAERGIRMPRAQLDQAIVLMTGLKEASAQMLDVNPSRLAAVGGPAACKPILARIADEVDGAFDALLATLNDPDYRRLAPDTVGLSQYPGGAELYAELARMHLTLDMTPEQIHQAGHDRMARVRAQMQGLFDEIGFVGNAPAYLQKIEADPAWRAEGEDAIGAFFRRYIDRIAPHIGDYFAFKPKADHGVAALPAALSGSMTFGYYEPPSPIQEKGRFIFNVQNLSRNALPNIGALNYHELVPGHHFHLASQRENDLLHPLRKASFINAYNEGWAEYAATLAGEMGMYIEPEEKFGRMMMDAFLTCRLVVDTGMNALGWSLDQARDYMRENGFMPEAEVCSESIRYSCDIPGQSLAYKLGDTQLLRMRETMRVKLGDRFDIRDFHDVVLKPGALPLPLVAANVEAATERLLAQVQ